MWKIRFYELKVAFFSLLKGRRVYQNWPRLCAKSYNVFERQIFNNLSAASDNTYFYLRCQCHHNFRKNHPPHNLKVAVWIFSGEVKNASCSCVACQVGFCNHFLALLLKLCKFSLYECESVTDLENEDNMQPKRICTSTLQQWHRKGRGDCINPQPVMEVLVTKTSLELDKEALAWNIFCMRPEIALRVSRHLNQESLTLKWLYHTLWLQDLSQLHLSRQNLEKVLKDPLPVTSYQWLYSERLSEISSKMQRANFPVSSDLPVLSFVSSDRVNPPLPW